MVASEISDLNCSFKGPRDDIVEGLAIRDIVMDIDLPSAEPHPKAKARIKEL